MNIQSMLQKDIPHTKTAPGAYEWWYFDAISDDWETQFVVIFYEGNPFSRRYITQQQTGQAQADHFPAISISIYRHQVPVYYSFTEVPKDAASFNNDQLHIQVDKHQMSAKEHDGQLCYHIKLDETLPSGDSIRARLEFRSYNTILQDICWLQDAPADHKWNILQPRAHVQGDINYSEAGKSVIKLPFHGQGYHDHNIGFEPLKHQFGDWYWGRFHFADATLIYYLMDSTEQEQVAWLFDADAGEMRQVFDAVDLQDYTKTLWGLQSARKMTFSNAQTSLMIQQSHLLDNGPFYQRFSSNAFYHAPGQAGVQSAIGISEYLCPPRIHRRLFWPLTNMRIRYKEESPHWVQRSPRLYRWTW